jgi:hypothetical protein
VIGPQQQAPEHRESDPDRPLSSVEVVAFALDGTKLKVLLSRLADTGRARGSGWALPGRQISVADDADLLSCARRVINEATGVTHPYCEQLGSWGSAKRDPRGWAATHVFIAVLPPLGAGRPVDDQLPLRWHAIDGADGDLRMALDHREILTAAVQRLRSKSEYTSFPAHLLPGEFTLTELQQAYEAVLGWPLEKSAFRTRILSTGLVQALDRVREAPHRPAMLFRLRDRASLVHFPRPLQRPA